MSRKPAKPRAAAAKAFAPPSAFGGFSTSFGASSLSYLSEPPDFSTISDANAVVSFKNLQKKDATTKAKALEDLVAYVQSHPHDESGGTEEAVLDAWVQLYPRTSIDNSRRVRELAHCLQYELMKSARKRMEKRVPKIVGSWLAGTFDRDRTVSRAAYEGLSSFLTTDDKILLFWKRCQQQILEFASESIKETADTLSDERSTNADDAEAKYHRVVASSLALVVNLLQKLDPSDLEKLASEYDLFFEDNKVWSCVTSTDSVVRKLSCQLLSVCIEKRPESINQDLSRLSKHFVAEGLKSSQSGSATEFVTALVSLTTHHPAIWTSAYTSKKSPTSRLRSFLEKGSQSGSARFWACLSQLLQILPDQVLPATAEGANDLTKAMRSGVSSKDEPRSNAIDAWSAYLSLTRHFIKTLPDDASRVAFVQEHLFPLTAHYLQPSPETSMWSTGCQPAILIKAYTSATTCGVAGSVDATRAEWNRLKDSFFERIRNSLPEGSKEHEKSQIGVSEEGDRWFVLTGTILDAHEKTKSTERPIPDIPRQPSLELLQQAFQLLETRRWKPFGAAATMESALKHTPELFEQPSDARDAIFRSLETVLPQSREELLKSPSAPYLFSSINLLGSIASLRTYYDRIWKENMATVLDCHETAEALPALTRLLASHAATPLAHEMLVLQAEVIKKCLVCAVNNTQESGWELFNTVITFDILAQSGARRLVKELVARIANPVGQANQGVLKALQMIAQTRPRMLLQDEDTHMSLMTHVLSLSERSGADVELAHLRSLVENSTSDDSRLLGLVQHNINHAGPTSLTVDTLAQQAIQAYSSTRNGDTKPVNKAELECLVPDTSIWKRELALFLQQSPDPALALTSSLGGAYFVTSAGPVQDRSPASRDRTGCSIPGRMARYTAEIASSGFDLESMAPTFQVEIIVCLSLTAELASDQLTVMGENGIWDSLAAPEAETAAIDLITATRKAIQRMVEKAKDWRDGGAADESRLVHNVLLMLIEEAKSLTPMGLYSARVISNLLQELAERFGFPSSGEAWLTGLNVLSSSPKTVLPAVAILSGLGDTLSTSKAVSNFCNRLVSDIAGARVGQEKALIDLVALNSCMQVYDMGELPVANNRLVFAVKQLTSWLDTPEELGYTFAAETCRALQRLLPCIKDVYGSYWEKTLDYCVHLWTGSEGQDLSSRLPGIHASLRLVSVLEKLEDPNDDLVDVLDTTAEKRSGAMLGLLKIPREKSTQPLEIVDQIICREVEKMPLEHVKEPSDLYGLVSSDKRSIQTAAFGLLHKVIPAEQKELSVDVLLDKKTARLPDELLSLLLDAPTLEAYPDAILNQFPSAIRCYLLSWHLIFDAFTAAANKVRCDYAENLKSEDYIGPLMDFTFDVLGHSAAHALKLDKANLTAEHIRGYDMGLAEAESEERSMQWLLVHIFYLVLKFVPGLFKTWFINCRSKQTKIAVEAWVSKYFAPIVISEVLDEVSEWAAQQEPPAADENELVVKVSRAAREVSAYYEVDEGQTASIAIKIPPGYPLESVSVAGVNRVGANEKKWQSWIMTTQGVITFSSGNIVDGLTTFRRNIAGAMKGQSECAICYSIVSSDRRMPDKRCATCKNLFHRSCLYRWFQSSSQNTCPLCRNPIDYLGADVRPGRTV